MVSDKGLWRGRMGKMVVEGHPAMCKQVNSGRPTQAEQVEKFVFAYIS